MEPTFSVGDPLVVNTDAYNSAKPKVGDIILFHPPVGAETNECGAPKSQDESCARPTPDLAAVAFVKRVVAGPGDHIRIVNGHVIRNGARQPDSYIRNCGPGDECTLPREITIQPGYWFTLGDNRGASDDSRFWGPIPTSAIIGRVDKCTLINVVCNARR
jgi:signal peptidase I